MQQRTTQRPRPFLNRIRNRQSGIEAGQVSFENLNDPLLKVQRRDRDEDLTKFALSDACHGCARRTSGKPVLAVWRLQEKP